MRLLFLLLCLFELTHSGLIAQAPQGHAHNDYAKENPLFRSLEAGFRSLEVDLYLKKGELRVSHWPLLLGSKPTFEELYLRPLFQHIEDNQGKVWAGDSSSLIMYIDFKTQGKTYDAVEKALEPYLHLLKHWEGDSLIWGPVAILIDGHLQEVKEQPVRFFSVQLPYEEYAIEASPALVPRLKAKWSHFFKWKGKGEIPLKEKKLLQSMVANTRKHGRTLRFYATGERPALWKALYDANPGWINVDDLQAWREFFEKEQNK